MEDQTQFTPASAAASPGASGKDRYPVPAIHGGSTGRFAPGLALTLLLWAAAWPFLTFVFLNRYDSTDAAWIHGLYERKDLFVKRQPMRPGGRIIIVGGSNALFGIDAELIERKLGVTTVNYATHGGLGGYVLDRARTVISPGDTVLLCPEYELWHNRATDLSDVEWAYVCTYDKRYIWAHGPGPALRMLYSQPAQAYVDALLGWREHLRVTRKGLDGAHNLVLLDHCGDLRADLPRRALTPGGIIFADPADPACAADDFRAFAAWARANQVRVLYSWPNMYHQSWPRGAPPGAVSTPAATRAFLDEMGFITLNEPSDTFYPRDWFTDTTYHPDGGCRRVRTEALIRELRPYFDLPGLKPPATNLTSSPEQWQGTYLVGGETNWLRPGNTFADRPGVQVKYLSPQPMECPDALTPADVAALAGSGARFWFDDPAVAALLPAGQWDFTDVELGRESLASWFLRYDHHLFLMSHTGRASPALPAQLPSDVREALAGTAAVTMGTGRWAGAQRIRTDPANAIIQIRSDILIRRDIPGAWLLARGSAVPGNGLAPHSRIVVNAQTIALAPTGSIAVAVLDPELGIVVNSGVFQGSDPETVWSLKRLSLRRPPGDISGTAATKAQ
jgi:hypothetical protein